MKTLIEKLKNFFRKALALESNRRLLKKYNRRIVPHLGQALDEAIKARDDDRLRYIGYMAALHTDKLDDWIDATMPIEASPELIELRDWFAETTEDIAKCLKAAGKE